MSTPSPDKDRILAIDNFIDTKLSKSRCDSRITVRRESSGVFLVSFVDRNILDEGNIQFIGQEICDLASSAPSPRIIISFENVDHLSSTALGKIIEINRLVQSSGGRLVLCSLDPVIQAIFTVTRLDRILPIYKDAEAALASFKQ